MNLDAPVSPHFKSWEFVVSQTATRLGIDNTPPTEAWDNIQSLTLSCVEPARMALGPLHVSSGYRCPPLNTAVGGAANSQHMLGEAADLIPYQGSLGDLFRWIAKNVPFDQLIAEFESWVHVSHKRSGPQRGERLLAHRYNGGTRYVPIDDEFMAKL